MSKSTQIIQKKEKKKKENCNKSDRTNPKKQNCKFKPKQINNCIRS